jgi:hypothetical protein
MKLRKADLDRVNNQLMWIVKNDKLATLLILMDRYYGPYWRN